jgi:predicted secreted protein
MAGGGVKSASATGDGVFANDATQIRLVTASMATTHWNARLVDEAGNTYTGAWNIDTVELSGDSNAETTYSVSLSSAGEIVFVAA